MKTNTSLADAMRRVQGSDFFYRYSSSRVAVLSSLIALVSIVAALCAGSIAPHDPFDLSKLSLGDSLLPPAWETEGVASYPLGTDAQGRDILSAILYGARISLLVGFASVVLSLAIGTVLGLLAGYYGGTADAILMRIADVQLSFPAILMALLIDGVARAIVSRDAASHVAIPILILSLTATGWVQYARTARGSAMVEKKKEYIDAAKIMGASTARILLRHLMPNVMGPLLVLATVHLGTAIVAEATLSFLGVGVPPTTPSLGTLIRLGSDFLFAGQWWIAVFPGTALVMMVMSVNMFGDWLRDALNPRLG